jgi:hypothetical protein
VCDQCWQLAGGCGAVQTNLDSANGEMTPLLVLDPAVEALLAGADEYDLLHPIDRLLVESGIRWVLLRHIAVPARMHLAGHVLTRTAPEHTRAADSPELWIDAVEARIRTQSGTGLEFRYAAKRRRWWRICHVLRCCADRRRRPLTWVSQEEIAAAVGCSDRTVRRCVAWLRAEGLLWEIVPGCQLPRQSRPDDETTTERAEREQRMAEAVAAEEAAIARARAELDLVRVGLLGSEAAQATPATVRAAPLDFAAPEGGDDLDGLVQLAPVYELRVPLTQAELAEAQARPNAQSVDLRIRENGHPPQVLKEDDLKSRSVHPVDNRPAPPGPYQKSFPRPEEPAAQLPGRPPTGSETKPKARQSEALRAADWLLRSRLDPRLCDEVSLRWLAAQIRGSHLLDRHNWTWDDLADQLHGYPEHTHLPRYIRDCRRWICARFQRAQPALSPTKLRIVQRIERTSPTLRQRRQAEAEAHHQKDIAARRAAINNCQLCDELGWLHVPAGVPTARCNHQIESSGW